LPRPEDTVFTEESETEITPERKQVIESRPEDFLESLQIGDSQSSTRTQAAARACGDRALHRSSTSVAIRREGSITVWLAESADIIARSRRVIRTR
jgi:hypothetical protein